MDGEIEDRIAELIVVLFVGEFSEGKMLCIIAVILSGKSSKNYQLYSVHLTPNQLSRKTFFPTDRLLPKQKIHIS